MSDEVQTTQANNCYCPIGELISGPLPIRQAIGNEGQLAGEVAFFGRAPEPPAAVPSSSN